MEATPCRNYLPRVREIEKRQRDWIEIELFVDKDVQVVDIELGS